MISRCVHSGKYIWGLSYWLISTVLTDRPKSPATWLLFNRLFRLISYKTSLVRVIILMWGEFGGFSYQRASNFRERFQVMTPQARADAIGHVDCLLYHTGNLSYFSPDDRLSVDFMYVKIWPSNGLQLAIGHQDISPSNDHQWPLLLRKLTRD